MLPRSLVLSLTANPESAQPTRIGTSLNADLSVAPEIAQLAAPFAPPAPARGGAAPRTDGSRAAELSELAAAPQRWWDLVRFDPGGPLRIPVPGMDGAWLLVLPPETVTDCDCRYATPLAGEAAEAGRPLRPGRVRVHGAAAERGGQDRHRVTGAGHGYSVTLHRAAGAPAGTPAGIPPGE